VCALEGGRLRLVAARNSYEDLDVAQRPRVERLCRLLLADPTEAQDVAQEVLMKLFQAQQTRPETTTWNRWVTRVTVNACRDRRRSAWWRRFRSDDYVLREDDLISSAAGPEDAAIAGEVRRRVWAAFRQLSRRQQEVFALRHVEDLSTADVAETLGMSEGSAKRHLFRAVHRLRLALRGAS